MFKTEADNTPIAKSKTKISRWGKKKKSPEIYKYDKDELSSTKNSCNIKDTSQRINNTQYNEHIYNLKIQNIIKNRKIISQSELQSYNQNSENFNDVRSKAIINNLKFDMTKGNFNSRFENNYSYEKELNNTQAVMYSLNSKINALSRSSNKN